MKAHIVILVTYPGEGTDMDEWIFPDVATAQQTRDYMNQFAEKMGGK